MAEQKKRNETNRADIMPQLELAGTCQKCREVYRSMTAEYKLSELFQGYFFSLSACRVFENFPKAVNARNDKKWPSLRQTLYPAVRDFIYNWKLLSYSTHISLNESPNSRNYSSRFVGKNVRRVKKSGLKNINVLSVSQSNFTKYRFSGVSKRVVHSEFLQ